MYVIPSKSSQQETVRALKEVIELVRSGELPVDENTSDGDNEAAVDEREDPSSISTNRRSRRVCRCAYQ